MLTPYEIEREIRGLVDRGILVTEVRMVPWDQMWHVCYKSRMHGCEDTWDRVPKEVALAVADRLERGCSASGARICPDAK